MVFAADVPRSRLVKYPLLLKQVVKYSDDTDDIRLLQAAITSLEKVSLGSLSRFLLLWIFWSISELWIQIHGSGYSISIESGSGYGSGSNTDPDLIRIQGFDDKNWRRKKYSYKLIKKIFDQKLEFINVQTIRRSLQPEKDSIKHFKNEIYDFFEFF
jgi:hypothetical protein